MPSRCLLNVWIILFILPGSRGWSMISLGSYKQFLKEQVRDWRWWWGGGLVAKSCHSCDPMDCRPPGSSVHGIFQAGILSGLPFPPPGDLPNPGIEPRSPALQADSLPTELWGKFKSLDSPWNFPGQNTGVGSHSLFQGIFPTQGSNPGFPHCRQILYQLSHQESPKDREHSRKRIQYWLNVDAALGKKLKLPGFRFLSIKWETLYSINFGNFPRIWKFVHFIAVGCDTEPNIHGLCYQGVQIQTISK